MAIIGRELADRGCALFELEQWGQIDSVLFAVVFRRSVADVAVVSVDRIGHQFHRLAPAFIADFDLGTTQACFRRALPEA